MQNLMTGSAYSRRLIEVERRQGLPVGRKRGTSAFCRFVEGSNDLIIFNHRMTEHHTEGENKMGEIIDKTKGRLKQAAGNLTGNKDMKREGKVDELKGKVEGVAKDLKHAIKGAAK